MARARGLAPVCALRAADLGDYRHAVPSVQAAVAVVISGHVVGDRPETRSQCAGIAAAPGIGQLPNGLDLAAQAAPRHGAAEQISATAIPLHAIRLNEDVAPRSRLERCQCDLCLLGRTIGPRTEEISVDSAVSSVPPGWSPKVSKTPRNDIAIVQEQVSRHFARQIGFGVKAARLSLA